ncbi:hypothetical protein [Microbacterium sp. 3J1]|uniref:hypothetical protein n=1 Tax=Microbacterium sp. 3J1 TaxID=861269 RepID=UPI000B11EBCF|nr:hypothetical protein [Microbacterium sp. 3J1]
MFDIVENADGSVTFSVFSRAWIELPDCLPLADRVTPVECSPASSPNPLSIGDLDCPPAIEEDAGDDSILMSTTQNAEQYGAEIDTLP